MSAWQICPMTAEHIPALAAIEKACFSAPWSEDGLREELENPRARFAVAVADGDAVGYMGVLTAADEGFITNVAVRPDRRRCGIASALIGDQITFARAQGLRRLALEVRVSNTAAIALYERMGFVQDGRRPRFYTAPAEDALLYSLYFER